MNDVSERAYAKLNLTLDVCGVRDDGYHEMSMIMQSITLCDELAIKLNDDARFFSKSNLGFLPCTDKNIAVKAAKLFFERAELPRKGAEIHLKKRIPVCAGMGGGSSDAAAVLRALNRYFGSPFRVSELEDMARALGSDVPFCVRGGTVLASGRGDELSQLPQLRGGSIVVCKPAFSISTPTLFAKIDERKSALHPDTQGAIDCIKKGDLCGVAKRLYNVFEDVLPSRYGEISAIKAKMLDLGALGTMMTGTGSAVFGIFENIETARSAHENLGAKYRECFLTSFRGRYL